MMGQGTNDSHSDQSTLDGHDMANHNEKPTQTPLDTTTNIVPDNEKHDVETPSPEPAKPAGGPPPPPNGGLTAWLHVVGGFMLYVICVRSIPLIILMFD